MVTEAILINKELYKMEEDDKKVIQTDVGAKDGQTKCP